MFRSPLKPSSGGPWLYTLYNKYKSTFQFSNLTKYGHGHPEDGFKGDRNM